MNPDDLDDFREQSIHIVEILRELDLHKYFSRNAIGATFYKVAAVNAIRMGIDKEGFLEIGEIFYTTLEKMIRDDDNLFLNDPEKEYLYGDENKKD